MSEGDNNELTRTTRFASDNIVGKVLLAVIEARTTSKTFLSNLAMSAT
jgi:hypothetical protein